MTVTIIEWIVFAIILFAILQHFTEKIIIEIRKILGEIKSLKADVAEMKNPDNKSKY